MPTGWEVLELAQDQFVDVFDVDGNQVLSPQEIKEGLNVNYVGCRFPPCYPTLTVHNPLFKIAEPANRYYLEEFGFTDSEVQALVVKATSERTDPIRGQAKLPSSPPSRASKLCTCPPATDSVLQINARDKSLDGLVLFKEFFSTFIAADPCLDGWYGVTCSDQGRVIGLSLQSNQLTGIIPPDIGNLTLLRGLHLGSKDRSSLSSNYIMGEIPSTISQMFQLQSLSLDHNLLTGSIPDAIGTLTSLTVLDLSWNRLNGPLPNITGLKELSRLFIDHNYLNGTVNELSELTKLEEVDISNNDLEGDLQAPLLGLPLLQSAYFHANPKARLNAQFSPLSPGLSAQYANQLGRANNAVLVQDKAVLLDLYQSSGGGGWFIRFGWEEPLSDPCLSSWYGVECDDAGRVISLLLNGNNLTGLLPRSIGHLAMLSTVNLAKNQLRGTIPPEIASLARLRYLDLSSNQLVGTIPAQLGGARELEMLLLNDNFLTGSLPPVADGAWTRIRNLNLARNRMQGSLPASLGALRSIEYLDLSSNLLVGTLPGSMGSMRSLKELRMEDNQLLSELPPQWAGMSELRMLNLARNRLHGRIPGEWGPGMKGLRFLVLYSNRLSGEIPPSLFSMKLLQQVVLSSNQLTGGIPSSILRVSGTLSLLDLRDNKLSGNLPSSLANLSQLLFLDLSSNSFSGFLPDYFNTSSHFLLLDRWGKVRLASNDFACPVPSQGAARTATCSTRNCPLDWVSNGTSCVKCSPGYSRRRGMERCSRCGQVGREEEERLCAVFSSDWQRVMTKQNDTSGAVKCILCSQAAALNLYVLPEMDAQSLQAESTGGGHEAQREVLTYNGSSAYPDGARYVGEVMLGAPHGRGTMTSRRGLYIGSFVSGKRSGRGTFTTVEGDEYGGEWGDGGRFFDNTGTNWGGVLNGKGYARYRSNAMVALRAILKGVMQPEEVGSPSSALPAPSQSWSLHPPLRVSDHCHRRHGHHHQQ
eukprot:768042-Hanusia_phi.AAC.5